MKRNRTPTAKIRLSKPLRRFDYQLVQARMDGLLFNIDRHLQRLKSKHPNDPTADRCLSLLDVLLRFARNSYHAVWFLTADTPPDHKRRSNYVLVVPAIN